MTPLLALTLAVTACGAGSGSAGVGGPTETASEDGVTTTADVTSVGGAIPTGPAPLLDSEVDGARVVVRSWVDPVPEEASFVRLTTTLIDDGDGFVACLGGVQESLPPQCGGPVVDGVEPGDWSRTEAGVTWGGRSLVVEWPAVDGQLRVVSDDEPIDGSRAPDLFASPVRTGVPTECDDIEVWLDVETMAAYAEAHPELTDVLRSVDGSDRVALGVVAGHLEEVRAALATDDAEPCLEEVAYSSAQLRATQDALSDAGLLRSGVVTGSGSGNALNRLVVEVTVADGSTIRQVLDAVVDAGGEPQMVVIAGAAEILD